MSRDRGDQPTRRTVAELLEQHGAKPGGLRHRHRRRADDADGESDVTTTAPHAIIDRIQSEQPDQPHRSGANGHSHRAGNGTLDDADRGGQAGTHEDQVGQPPTAFDDRAGRRPPPPGPAGPPPGAPPGPVRPQGGPPPAPRRTPWGRSGSPPPPQDGIADRLGGEEIEEPTQRVQPDAWRHGPDQAERTEQFDAFDEGQSWPTPRDNGVTDAGYPPAAAAGGPGHNVAGGYPDAEYDAAYDDDPGYDVEDAYVDDPAYDGAADEAYAVDDYYVDDPAYDGAYYDDDAGYDGATYVDDPAYDGVADEAAADDEHHESAASSGRQWLAVAAQLTLGVVGGAAFWFGFNWLWTRVPAVALGAALLVIAGLVWIVRKIRKADDMQTTLLAVLVGLIVTVSPAALLLLSL